MSERLLAVPKVRERIGGISRTTIWHWVREGTFPAPIRIGSRRIMWRESDIDAWIKSQAKQEPA